LFDACGYGCWAKAVQEVLALPQTLPERAQVLRLIKNWQIRVQQNQEAEEAEMAVQLSQAYLAWEQATLEQGKLAGRIEGEQIGAVRGKLEAVPALVERGFSAGEIAQILGLTLEQVQSVQP